MSGSFISSINSLEQLADALSDIKKDNADEAASKVADITRKAKEVLDQSVADLEQLLSSIDMEFCSPIAVAALKTMVNHRMSDERVDRAVEIYKQLLDEGKLVKEHVRLVPDFFLPLAREIGFYLLQTKQNATLAYDITLRSLTLFLNEDEGSVTSVHSALMAAAIKTGNFAAAREFIYSPITAILSELPPSAEHIDVLNRRSRCNAPPYFDSKYILCYLYYSAMVLMKLGEYHRANQLLEVCITIPGSSASVIQMDALKKYYIVSLMLNGEVIELQNRSPSVLRAWKAKNRSDAYISLATALQSSGNKLEATKKVVNEKHSTFKKDCNLGLVNELLQELRKKAVLNVAKSFSSISLPSLAKRAYCDEVEVADLLKELVELGKLQAEFVADQNAVRLNITKNPVTMESIEKKSKLLDMMRSEVSRMDIAAQLNPSFLVRSMKGSAMAFFQDDEGLSESACPMDA